MLQLLAGIILPETIINAYYIFRCLGQRNFISLADLILRLSKIKISLCQTGWRELFPLSLGLSFSAWSSGTRWERETQTHENSLLLRLLEFILVCKFFKNILINKQD